MRRTPPDRIAAMRLIDDSATGDWREQALCAQTDPELFFQEDGDRAKFQVARAICARCDVSVQCLEAALEQYEVGIWAGTTERQRGKMRKKGHAA